jgi:hypothetical protein
MKNTVEYDGTEPQLVKFPYDITAFIEGATAVIYCGNSLYQSLSEEAQMEVCERLWEFDFVEEVEIKDE